MILDLVLKRCQVSILKFDGDYTAAVTGAF